MSIELNGEYCGQESEKGKEDCEEEDRQAKEVTPPTSAIPTAICANAALE
jgi:hypothetical protein